MSQERRHPYGAQASLACGSPAFLPVPLTQVQPDQAARSQECSDEQQTKGYPETNRAQSKSFRHRNVPEPLKNRREQCVRSPTVREGHTRQHFQFKKIWDELLD
jgi:hypothetical protein